jgi:hypothetical protein
MRVSAQPIRVALTLALLGAIVGALAGVLVAIVLTSLDGLSRTAIDLDLWRIGASFGAPLGALLFPVAGWALMRQVALGRALLGTLLGTVAGATIGWVWPTVMDRVSAMLIGSVTGFGAAVLVLRRIAAATRADSERQSHGAA